MTVIRLRWNHVIGVFAAFLWLLAVPVMKAVDHRVTSAAEIQQILAKVQPGDTLTMAAGTWIDEKIVFNGHGTEREPILLRAERPGRVILTGASSLRIAGTYLVVQGLYFKDGYSSDGDVIEFRHTNKAISNNCRLTQIAIEDYNPQDQQTGYKWVSLYGSHNRVDHCVFKGKDHVGSTLVVWLSEEPNYHLIDHNYFIDRPVLGRNDGESIPKISPLMWMPPS